MQLEQTPCPRCGKDFPVKRKELGYHVCTSCSTTKPVVGIITVEGLGDHTYNDLIIMDQDKAMSIARQAAELSGRKVYMEFLDYDEEDTIESVANRIRSIIERDDLDHEDEDDKDQDDESVEVEGIDY